ncbi:MAG: ABC transporter ATP-binding protein [Pseudomonadota bacterium]
MLQIRNLSHRYGAQAVLDSVDLDVAAGEIVCLLGASGSGKSTLLRIVAGLEVLQEGSLRFNDEALGPGMPTEQRRFGLVFQDHVLFPHLSVGDNVGFGLADVGTTERRHAVHDELAAVGLAHLESRFPHTLSGGQQQRVALARALAARPRLLLMDEPFASVDSTLRRALREDARRVLRERNVPAVVVTHDAREAMELADQIAVIDAGRLVQCDTPDQVWRAPANRFVAELFFDTDAFSATGENGTLHSAFGPLPASKPVKNGRYAVIAQPAAIYVEAADTSPLRVADRRFLGDRVLLLIAAEDQRLRALAPADSPLNVGDAVNVRFEAAGLFHYNQE